MVLRLKIFLGTLLLLMLNTAVLFAQGTSPGEPCEGNDPDSTCPLDNWVIILAVVAVVFATWHLYRKRKAQKINLSR
jgi:hypothetical protein